MRGWGGALPSSVVTDQQLNDWVSQIADSVIATAERLGTPVVCASGLSPSGPIHLGNLREVMTPHLVADEVARRGVPSEHLISWDDFDRFRKVPAGVEGVDESWAEHIGKPLSDVPPPRGSAYDSWATHFRVQCEQSLAELGIEFRGISQTAQYTSGAYTEQILLAMSRRQEIDEVLGRYRTLPATSEAGADSAAPASEGVGEGFGDDEEDEGGTAGGYYPYKPYCSACGTDFTTVTGYDDATTQLSWTCRCGHSETVLLKVFRRGKLVWKVDWPMRWGYEKVIFEPSGVDHQSPGSSFVVGKDLAPMFGWQRPIGPMYAFVGIEGMAKMSSSRGGVPTPADGLTVMEPQLMRWLYARRRLNQSFTIDLGPDLARLYDEWDALDRRVQAGSAQPGETAAWTRASGTATVTLPRTPYPVAYRTLASIVDITTGDTEQLLRIVSALDTDHPTTTVPELRPRLDRVQTWVSRLADSDRTVVRRDPATELIAAASDEQRAALRLLLDGNDADLAVLEDAWDPRRADPSGLRSSQGAARPGRGPDRQG